MDLSALLLGVCLKHLLHFDFLRYHLIKLLPEFKNSAEASYLL